MATKIENKKIVKTKTGDKYEIVGNGKIKKVSSLEDISKLDIKKIVSADYEKATVDLYRYFKERDENTVYKKGSFIYRAFKVWYSEKGLNVVDYINYHKTIEHGLKGYPKPEKVYATLSTIKTLRVNSKKKEREEEVKMNEVLSKVINLLKLKPEQLPQARTIINLYKEFNKEKTISNDVKEVYSKKMMAQFTFLTPKEQLDIESLRKKTIASITRIKKVTDVKRKMYRLIPNKSFSILYGKLLRRFDNGDIRYKEFKQSIIDLLKDDSIFHEKKKHAGIFVCKPAYHANEMLSITDDKVEFQNTTGIYSVAKSKFLAYYMLHELPNINVAMCKYLRGEITASQFRYDAFMRDRTCILDYKQLEGEHNQELFDILEEIRFDNELETPLEYVYRNETTLQIHQKVKVVWYSHKTYYTATVIKNENGVCVRYADGTVDRIYKHQKVTVVKETDLLPK